MLQRQIHGQSAQQRTGEDAPRLGDLLSLNGQKLHQFRLSISVHVASRSLVDGMVVKTSE